MSLKSFVSRFFEPKYKREKYRIVPMADSKWSCQVNLRGQGGWYEWIEFDRHESKLIATNRCHARASRVYAECKEKQQNAIETVYLGKLPELSSY